MRAVWLSSTYYLDEAVQGLSANAERLFTRSMAHCGAAESSGHVSEDSIKMLGLPNPRKLAAELVAARIFVPREGGGWYFRSWESWNSAGDELIARRKADRERQARLRANKRKNSRDTSRDTEDRSDTEIDGYSSVELEKTHEKSTSTSEPQACAQPVETASEQRERQTLSRNMSRDVTDPEESREESTYSTTYENSRNVGADERGLTAPIHPSASRLVATLIPDTIPAAVRTGLRIAASELMNRDKVHPDVVTEALRRWLTKPGAGPGLLAHIAADIIRERTAPAATGGRTHKMRAFAELAAEERALEQAQTDTRKELP